MSDQLAAQPRTKLGSRPSKYLRFQGRIPCSLQGEGKDNLDISIDAAEFAKSRRDHVHLYDLLVEGSSAEPAMVRELQWDAMGDHIIHVEFLRVVRGQKTTAEVGLEFVGHATGGVLNHLMTHITISCLPSQIPDSVEVNVAGMEPGQAKHISDIVLPEGAEHVLDAEAIVATVNVVRADVVAAEDEAGETEGEATEGGSEA